MADVIYKRSFYDKMCRGVVGVGLLYAYTKGVIAIDNIRDNNKSEYKIVELAGNDMLMYKGNNNMVKIQKDWFNPNNADTNSTFSIKSIDNVVNSFSLK